MKAKTKLVGFTLVELLAVIVILTIILIIAVPRLFNFIGDRTKDAFDSDAKLVIKSIEQVRFVNDGLNLATIDETNIKSILGVSGSNYASFETAIVSNNIYVKIEGTGRWDGLTACGTKAQMDIYETGFDTCLNLYPTAAPEVCFTFAGGVISDYDYLNPLCPSDLIIPSTIGGVPVTEIGDYSLGGYDLTSLVIPEGVTSIGYDALAGNSLTSVTLPSTLTTIRSWSFSNNFITSLVIPSGITEIESGVFYDNALTSLTLNNGLTTIGDNAFSGNFLTNLVIPNTVTTLNYRCFEVNDLASITLSNNLITIGPEVFKSNNLTSITIPNSINLMDWSAFYGNQLTSIIMPKAGITIGDYFLTNNNSFRLTYQSGGAGTYTGTQSGTWTKQ